MGSSPSLFGACRRRRRKKKEKRERERPRAHPTARVCLGAPGDRPPFFRKTALAFLMCGACQKGAKKQ
ncbi:hypothetical protein [Pandoravirus japonicus]|uniref:Uncharacterized protein n=1 Tax=Pandoravirus japonicus TaxID=2823154 RepID=A0A811BPB4_9VIRU|nr:hypothetical protein [Pandoravirus japonicus]